MWIVSFGKHYYCGVTILLQSIFFSRWYCHNNSVSRSICGLSGYHLNPNKNYVMTNMSNFSNLFIFIFWASCCCCNHWSIILFWYLNKNMDKFVFCEISSIYKKYKQSKYSSVSQIILIIMTIIVMCTTIVSNSHT